MRLFRILMIVAMVAFLMPAATMCAQADAPPTPPAGVPAPPPGSPMPLASSARVVCPANVALIPMRLDVNMSMGFLEVTEEQKPKLAALQKTFDTRMMEIGATVRSTTKQLIDALCAEGTTPAKLKELGAKASDADAKILQARLDFWLDLKAVLTADQYKKLVEMAQRRMEGPISSGSGGRPGGLPVVPPAPPAAPPPPAP
ncbi:MAG: hypothetical protein Q7T82_16450 [Armatimonadota bacterium]|nr:hypothetical protein [Armatimonadota bacterium]